LTLEGTSAGLASGLTIEASASGSNISGILLASFVDAGLVLNGAANTRVSDISVTDSGTGLRATGDLTNTEVVGSTFRRIVTGAAIDAAQNLTYGGLASGAANTIESASTGIFATGDCLGTQVIATVFGPGVTQLYDTSTARGLVVTP
jgi:hypothetical protein